MRVGSRFELLHEPIISVLLLELLVTWSVWVKHTSHHTYISYCNFDRRTVLLNVQVTLAVSRYSMFSFQWVLFCRIQLYIPSQFFYHVDLPTSFSKLCYDHLLICHVLMVAFQPPSRTSRTSFCCSGVFMLLPLIIVVIHAVLTILVLLCI